MRVNPLHHGISFHPSLPLGEQLTKHVNRLLQFLLITSAACTRDIIIGIINCNTGTSALPDISALTLRRCISLGLCVHIGQSIHACVTTIICTYVHIRAITKG